MTTGKLTASLVTKTEKAPAPPPPPPLTPVQQLNERIAAKRKEALARLEKIRRDRTAHEKTWPPVIPDDAGPAAAAAIETAWQDERDRLHRAERNFSETAILMELDDDRGGKPALIKALAYLREKAKEARQPSIKVEASEGRHLFQAPAIIPPQAPPTPHQTPVGGLFGVEVLPSIDVELSSLEREIAQFPEGGLPFYKIVDQANKVDGRLFRSSPPPPMAISQSRPFIPKWG